MKNTTTITVRAVLLVATVAVFAGASSFLVSACAPPSLEPLARRDVVATPAVDPARPCGREAPAAPAAPVAPAGVADPAAPPAPPPPPPPPPPPVDARFDAPTNTITLASGQNVPLPEVARIVNNPAALRETAQGEWLLGASMVVLGGASLQVTAPSVRWLMLSSGPAGFVTLKTLGGGVHIEGSCVTSWDAAQGRVDSEYADGRSFVLARDGAQLTIDRAELRYLGYGEVESYGLSWRTEGTGGRITGSIVSHLYYGLYTYEVSGLAVQDNEFHDNVLYGIDPHTRSHDLLIERNVVHHNGKHGIILAEDCTDSVIRENVVYDNAHHGIVLYLRSDRNVVEGNEVFRNTAQGINLNESSGNTVRGNSVYDNLESGIGVAQTAQDNLVEQNQVRANQQDGIRLVSEATQTTLRANVIGENVRYGVYVDSDGPFDLAGNTIFGSRTGVMLRSSTTVPDSDNSFFDNTEADVVSG
jgi:parallel beta-helix repeat protein